MKKDSYDKFVAKLARAKLLRCAGFIFAGKMKTLGYFAIFLVLLVLADGFFALDERFRIFLDISLLLILAVMFIVETIRIFSVSPGEIAVYLDEKCGNKREEFLSALELGNEKTAREGITGFLSAKILAAAVEKISTASAGKILPVGEIKRRLLVIALQIAVCAVLILVTFTSSSVSFRRILMPWKDIPPYSRLVFNITPNPAKVIYGGNIELRAEITGAPIDSQVWFNVKHGDNLNRMACFREGETAFVQKLEKLTVPAEFCFSCGKARSKWQKVELLLQPRISFAKIKVVPPEWTRLPEISFLSGTQDLSGYKNSKVEMTVVSNRPLSGGKLTMKDVGTGNDRTLDASLSNSTSAAFSWEMDGDADIEVSVTDILGTPCDSPLKLRQKITPDLAPEIVVREPEPFLLATPNAVVALSAEVTDDLGLKRIDLIRAVVGYRDRISLAGPSKITKDENFSKEMDLSKIGLSAGDVMEIYFEAVDTNPSSPGATSSDISRIQIISEEEYAEILRTKTAVEDIIARFQMLDSIYREMKTGIEKLAEMNSNKASPDELKKQAEKLARENAAAMKVVEKMMKDFAIYPLEEEEEAVLTDLMDMTKKNSELLKKISNGEEPGPICDQLLAILKEREPAMEQFSSKTNDTIKVSAVMACAAKFAAIRAEQKAIVRKLDKFAADNEAPSKAVLQELGRKEAELREKLAAFLKELGTAADGLPGRFDDLRNDSHGFIELVDKFGIPKILEDAALEGKNMNGDKTSTLAKLALEKMDALLKQDNNLSQMAKGNFPAQGLGDGDSVRETLQQMLRAMMKQKCNGAGVGNESGRGSGAGGGGLGDVNDGYFMNSYSPLNIPVAGPQRSSYSPKSGAGAQGEGQCPAGKAAKRNAKTERGGIIVKERRSTETINVNLDEVPEKYRDAVKKYFGEEE